jgi:hypothetical protein
MNTADNEYQSDRATVGLPALEDASQINDRSSLYFSKAKKSESPASSAPSNDPYGIR